MIDTQDQGLAECVADICAVLQAENLALEQLDIAAATSLVAQKCSAADALMAALARSTGAPPAVTKANLERLRSLSATNKRLLERAMAAQQRLLSIIAGAVPRAMKDAGPYGRTGQRVATTRMPAIAVSRRV